jgi:hydrogenase maturation protease
MEEDRSVPSIRLLVIGYGNTLRSDDGAGPYVAEAVEALKLPGVQVLAAGLLTPELADPIARANTVVFVDASVEAETPIGLRRLAPAESSQILAHAADPRTLLALARDVFGHAPDGWWLTLPAESLEIGEGLSATTLSFANQAIAEISKIAAARPGYGPGAG